MVNKTLPIFDEMGCLFGTVVSELVDGRRKVYFHQRDSTVIDMSDINKFTAYLKRCEIPIEEITKAIRFFNQEMLASVW